MGLRVNSERGKRFLATLSVPMVLALTAGVPVASAASVTNLFFYVNAGDAGSYSASTPTKWTDLSEANRDGTIFGSVSYDSGTDALVFPGSTSSYVDMGPGFNSFGTGMTIEFEGHFGAVNQGWERIFDFGNGAENDNIWVGVFGESFAPNELAIELWDGTTGKGRCISTGGMLTTNTFAKYVITMDGSTCRIYKNGVEVQTRVGNGASAGSYSSAASGSTYAFLPQNVSRANNYIGKSNWSSDPAFNGAIKYVRIYTTALGASDIADNAATYTLTYAATDSDSGSAPASKTGNGLITLDENTGSLVRSGYTFAGWATSPGQSTAIDGPYDLTADTTLHPVWTAIATTTVATTSTTIGSDVTTTTAPASSEDDIEVEVDDNSAVIVIDPDDEITGTDGFEYSLDGTNWNPANVEKMDDGRLKIIIDDLTAGTDYDITIRYVSDTGAVRIIGSASFETSNDLPASGWSLDDAWPTSMLLIAVGAVLLALRRQPIQD